MVTARPHRWLPPAQSAPPAASSELPTTFNINPVVQTDPATGRQSPFFPIGWYSFGTLGEKQFLEVVENGANTVLFAGLGRESWQKGEALARLQLAEAHDVKVIIGLNGSIVSSVRYGQPQTYGVIPDYVKSFKDHPALLGWMLGDEMSADGSAQGASDTVRLIREHGSQHQTWQVHPHIWSNEEVTSLMAATDVCTYDGYTYLVGTDVFAEECSTRILAWQVAKADLIAAAGWAGNVNVTQAVGEKCGDIDFRFPTYEEYRWNVFSAITSAGARGTLNWIYTYWGGFYRGRETDFFTFRDQIVRPVNLEQQMIARAMEAGYNVGRVTTNFDEPTTLEIPPCKGPFRKFNKVGRILLHDDQRGLLFLIATNNESAPRTVRFTISHLPGELKSLSVDKPHDKRQLLLNTTAQVLLKKILTPCR